MSINDIRNYTELLVWKKGIHIAKEVYTLTKGFPRDELYGLTNQMRRAAVSVPSNIAEGQARGQTKEFSRFLRIALGSLAELDTQLVLAMELCFIDQDRFQLLDSHICEERRMLYGLINHLPSTEH